ncbi:MAG: site-specific DNA-methyltransferase [Deltaproteobacteria bacterium]|nr:site-specific DNA-methyltransferase [Deltaproteobacteria bacterium]
MADPQRELFARAPGGVELHEGDNLVVGRALVERGVAFDLLYVDPPFGVGSKHGARTRAGEERASRSSVAYDDAWEGIDAFLAALEPRVSLFRELLSERGTLYLHLDHRTVHEAKVLCDRVFGREAFRGEIVWVPGNGARSRKAWGASHQTILVYTRTDRFLFHADDPALREPYAEGSAATHFKHVDGEGRRFRERTIQLASGPKTYRYPIDHGRRLGTVWTDAPAMAANTPLSRETTGYPHQKPEKLLDRIVRASSDEGSLVGDLFCGSGTTLAVAAKLGRRAIGCDASPLAIEITRARLARLGFSGA